MVTEDAADTVHGLDLTDLPGCPEALLAVLRSLSASVVRFTDHAPRYHVRLDSIDGPLFAWYSAHPDDADALVHELAVRGAVGEAGLLRCPPLLATGPTWRVERMIVAEAVSAGDVMALVVEAWSQLRGLELPRRSRPAAGGSPLERVMSFSRLAASPLPLRDVFRARRLARSSSLPAVTCHGDFHVAHVMPRDGAVWVIDWELSGRGPLGMDPMLLWASLDDADAREDLLSRTLAAVGSEHERGVLELRYVALVRRIASKLAELPRFGDRDAAAARRLLALLPEARSAIS